MKHVGESGGRGKMQAVVREAIRKIIAAWSPRGRFLKTSARTKYVNTAERPGLSLLG